MTDDDAFLGEFVPVINAMVTAVTTVVTDLSYDPAPMRRLTHEELRNVIASLLGLIRALSEVVGEEAVLRAVRVVALSAQRGSFRD